jgi:hypothetical protein
MTPEPANLFFALAAAQWVALIVAMFAFSRKSRWAAWLFLITAVIGVTKSSWRFFSGCSGIAYFVMGVTTALGVGIGLAYASWVKARGNAFTEPDGLANESQPTRSETNRMSSAAGSRR